MSPTFICAQPRTLYYAWQLEVMIQNFIESGIAPGSIEVLLAYSGDPNSATNSRDTLDLFDRLNAAYPRVRFFSYEDTRPEDCSYVSSIRPHVIAKHISAHPKLSHLTLFYHDCDILLTGRPDFTEVFHGDKCYVSDASSYISAKYLSSVDHQLYLGMCEIVGINPDVPLSKIPESGGAQYVLKGTDSSFWMKVERDCESIYKFLSRSEIDRKSVNPSYIPIQKWTSDMWALLWNLWVFGHEVAPHPSLRFCWATDPIQMIDTHPIMHNAGVTGPGGCFFKQDYTDRLPYGATDSFDRTKCSYFYFTQVKRIGETSCLR